MNRRDLLKGLAAAGLSIGVSEAASAGLARPRGKASDIELNPFQLGVAAGDPFPNGFVIWTRLAPAPLRADGGMAPVNFAVRWEISRNETMTDVVQSGVAVAQPEWAHSVHVGPSGLEPGRDYFYRFRIGDYESRIGRATTLPAPGATVAQLRFGQVGCQDFQQGYFTALRRLAGERNLDFVFCYGDYIYNGKALLGTPRAMPSAWRQCSTLADFRRRYGLYKRDADLRALHRSCNFIASFDDHEVANNWYSTGGGKGDYLLRRAAAFQAWYEHMPVRRRGYRADSPIIFAYRNYRYGKLLELAVLDTRQYRSAPACDDIFDDCPDAAVESRTMLGAAQERWLSSLIAATPALWQVLAQQAQFTQMDWRAYRNLDESTPQFWMDGWDEAAAARARVIAMFAQNPHSNPVVLSGDLHRGIAYDIPSSQDPSSPPVGAEFLGTSVSSGGDGRYATRRVAEVFSQNPQVKLISEQRGYTLHTVSATGWRAEYKVVPYVSAPGAPVSTLNSFYLTPGKAGLQA
jgi:alkaline phosphatase D